MLEVIKIDSLKLRLPLYKVEIIDSTFCEKYKKLYIDTGEEGKEVNLDKHKVHLENGISTRIGIAHVQMGSTAQEQVFFQVNAKMLKEDYFLGLTKETFPKAWKYIMDLQIVYCDYKTFLQAYVSDIDFAFDTEVKVWGMREANWEIYRNVKPENYRFVEKPFTRGTNIGMEFNKRDKATPGKPFVKIYHKGLELKYKSNEFAEAFLQGQDFENIGRLEFTLKNSKHRKHLGLEFVTLEDLLEMEEGQKQILKKAVFNGIFCYISKSSTMRKYRDLSPTDQMILYFIDRYIEKGADHQAVYYVLETYETPQEKSRMKKKLKQLLENVENKKRFIQNEEAMSFLRTLKIDFEFPDEKANPEQ